MVTDFKLGLIMLFLLFASFATEASLEDDSYRQCEQKVLNWAASSINSETDEDKKDDLRDFLFFLHVPRTGGRTYHHCILQKLNLNAWDCPSSYDHLRFDPRETKCRLLSTHDDFSVMSKLPKERTSLLTVLRNPIERVFSTYEFSVEIASKFMKYTNLTSAARMVRVAGSSNKTSAFGVSTLDIWPWKYLVPWMKEDLCARRDARELSGQVHLTTENPYDMEDFLMPLEDFIYDPIVRDLVHNGASFQIAGLTNNSFFKEAHEIRRCVMNYQNLGEYVLEVAKKRLDSMLYVGLTDKHEESASMFAKIVGAQVMSRYPVTTISQPKNVSEHSSLLLNMDSNAGNQRNSTYRKPRRVPLKGQNRAARRNLTVEGLIEMYESCASSQRIFQSGGWVTSLRQISHGNFTKEARGLVPEEIIDEIASLNSLDLDLYSYAQKIFIKQQERLFNNTAHTETIHSEIPSWRFPYLTFIAGLLLLLFGFLLRRKSSKIKL